MTEWLTQLLHIFTPVIPSPPPPKKANSWPVQQKRKIKRRKQ